VLCIGVLASTTGKEKEGMGRLAVVMLHNLSAFPALKGKKQSFGADRKEKKRGEY